MIEVVPVAPEEVEASHLLASYVEELHRRLPEGAADFERTWSAEQYGSSRGRVLVARLDGVPVGCAGLREHTPSAGELKRLYVATDARRRGVGRALLSAVERCARELGYRRVVLDTAEPLTEALRLYGASGYAKVAPFNANPHAAHWFEKTFPLDDEALWGAFAHRSLPEPEWTHRSHVRVAYLHLLRWNLDESHLRMRVGIVRLNASHGLEETATRGYHETMTRVWLRLLAHRCSGRSFASSDAFLSAHPELLDKQLPLRFYTRERLLSLQARTMFLEPDILPLPAIDPQP
jgi:GNAT superfamily N-acetyltransferase